MKWEDYGLYRARLVADDGLIVDEIEGSSFDGAWTLAYNRARYVSKEAAQKASERIHGASIGSTQGGETRG